MKLLKAPSTLLAVLVAAIVIHCFCLHAGVPVIPAAISVGLLHDDYGEEGL